MVVTFIVWEFEWSAFDVNSVVVDSGCVCGVWVCGVGRED